MTATVMDGKAVATRLRERVAERAAAFRSEHGRAPGLATVLVGGDPASAVYVRMKRRACEELGVVSFGEDHPDGTSQSELLAVVERLAADDAVDGILVQLPLPAGIDTQAVLAAVPVSKDVDGFHAASVGALVLGLEGLRSATPHGVMRLLDEYGVELAGARAVVVGRSNIVGKPMALMLLERDATVTLAHRHTRDLGALTREADVLVAAAGVPRLITGDMVKPGAVVVDVGTSTTEHGLVGDVAYAEVAEVAGLITPVPGGVGPMTIAALFSNTLDAAEARATAPAEV